MDLREMVRPYLPEDAFLRRDRGRGMYVTNAPAKGWSGTIPGFLVEVNGAIACISILPETMCMCDYEPDRLATELERFRGCSVADGSGGQLGIERSISGKRSAISDPSG